MSWSPDDELAPTDAPVLAEYIAALSASEKDGHLETAAELEALDSIYPGAIRLLSTSGGSGGSATPPPPPPPSVLPPLPTAGQRLRYQLAIPVSDDEPDGARLRVLVSLPSAYPASESAPQLMLCGRYIGAFAIDAGLFGDITRTYITLAGVPFTPGEVCIFDGLMYAQSRVRDWHDARVAEGAAGEAARAAERSSSATATAAASDDEEVEPAPRGPDAAAAALARLTLSAAPDRPLPTITSSPAIVDRKSAFVGHAARITDAHDVAAVVAHLLTDRKIARAAHPTIWAFRAVRDVGGAAGKVVESDYDDDGETQAGSRLKHLLEILELDNVLVVVTRWYGGTLLGPDRFKHINQAARDALELAGLLDESAAAGRKKGRR